MKRKVTLSYELTLPQNIYPKLDRLFNTFMWETRRTVRNGWNEETLKLLEGKGSACSVLKGTAERPSHLPSRFHRNVLEMAGEILRSQIERKRIYEYIAEKPCRSFIDERIVAKELKTSPLFVLNVQRQVRNLSRSRKFERDYLKVANPDFSGDVVITSHLKFRVLLSILPLSLLLSYLRLVETSYLKSNYLLKYLQVDKYGQEKWDGSSGITVDMNPLILDSEGKKLFATFSACSIG